MVYADLQRFLLGALREVCVIATREFHGCLRATLYLMPA